MREQLAVYRNGLYLPTEVKGKVYPWIDEEYQAGASAGDIDLMNRRRSAEIAEIRRVEGQWY